MCVVVILIFANCLCGSALSTIVEAQQLSHGRSIRQAPSSTDSQNPVTEMNIAFDLPDITATIQLQSGSVQLEGFKSINNDKIDMAGTKTSELFWVSIGHPHFIKTEDHNIPGNVKLFHSSSIGFATYVQMMTEEQRAALATAAQNKYQINIADRQVVHLILSKFYCNILLYDETGSRYLVTGNISDFRHFPLRMDFDIPPGKIEKNLLTKSINESESDLQFECHIESSGGKLIKSNTLSISYEQSQQIGLEERLFGPAGSNGSNEVYVTRNQLTELAHEMYSTLNIIEEYQMPESQFSEAFVNDFISQLASSQFKQVPIETVLASISKYSLDIGADLRPDIIKKDIGSFLSVNKTDEKSRIIFDEKKYKDWANSNKLSGSLDGSVLSLFKVSLNAASDISNKGSTNDQTLSDQMHELNTLAQNEAKWEIEGEKIVPKSLNVARIMRSNMKTSLTFKRIRIQQFHAPFERNFKMYTTRSSQLLCQNVSTTKERYEEMLESMSHNILHLMNASRDLVIQTQKMKIDSIQRDLMSQSQKLDSVQRDLMSQSQKLDSVQKRFPGKVCPYGFDYMSDIDQCLYLNLELMTWDNARNACARMKTGAEMVSIKDSAKQEAVRRYLQHRFTKQESAVCFASSWAAGGKVSWLSGQTGNPSQCSTDFLWKPVGTTETPFNNTNWGPSQPDCHVGKENCVVIASSPHLDYRWNDFPCGVLICSLCEF